MEGEIPSPPQPGEQPEPTPDREFVPTYSPDSETQPGVEERAEQPKKTHEESEHASDSEITPTPADPYRETAERLWGTPEGREQFLRSAYEDWGKTVTPDVREQAERAWEESEHDAVKWEKEVTAEWKKRVFPEQPAAPTPLQPGEQPEQPADMEIAPKEPSDSEIQPGVAERLKELKDQHSQEEEARHRDGMLSIYKVAVEETKTPEDRARFIKEAAEVLLEKPITPEDIERAERDFHESE